MNEQPSSDPLCYVVSVRHTDRKHQFITFWRPNSAGYAWPLSWAGKYPRSTIRLSYHNNGWDTITVPCDVVDKIAEPTPRGRIDNDAGPIVYNTEANWNVLLSSVIAVPSELPKPQIPRQRKRA